MLSTTANTDSSTGISQQKYARLLARTLPSVIETDQEHRRLLAQAELLMEKGDDACSAEELKLLALLSRLLDDYEADRFRNWSPPSAAESLRHLMEARDMRPKDLWPVLGSRSATSQILSGKRPVSKAQAKRLAAFFHIGTDPFLY